MSSSGTKWEVTPTTTVAEAIMEILKLEGIPFLSAYPTTPLIDAAAKRNLRPVLCRQERVGVGIADGYARMTGGRPAGVFAMQWGPGVENAYAGIATTFADSVPVLMLPLGYRDDKQDSVRFHNGDRLRPVVKSFERLRSPDRLTETMKRAFSRMKNGRPGPVAVEIPMDLAEAPVGEKLKPYSPVTQALFGPDPAEVDRAADMLLAAQRPLIIAGQGVLYAEASAELQVLAELLDAPVGTTLEGKSAFDEMHPLSMGAGGLSMPTPLREMLGEADVALGVGTSFTRHPMVIPPPRRARLIQITVDEADINKDVNTECALLGDAKLALRALIAAVKDRLKGKPARSGTAQAIAARRDKWMEQWTPLLTSNSAPINHYRVVGELGKVLDPRRSVLTHDSGSPRDQILPFYRTSVPHGYIGWGKSHALGSGLGLIMGAKLARPDWDCVNVMGDAAFGMVGLDFETAVRNRIGITTIVLNNGTMAIETDALAVSHQRYGARDIGGHYADLARSMGGWSRRVENPAEIAQAIRDALAANARGEAALLEMITSPEMTPFSSRAGERPQH